MGTGPDSDCAIDELISKYSESNAAQIALAYAYRGEVDHAFEWMERAFAQRDSGLAFIKIEPILRSLHGDSRWGIFLEKMGLVDTG